MAIPKIIWQTWKKGYSELPVVNNTDLKELTKTWITQNRSYEYRYCDDEVCLELIKSKDCELYDCILECERLNIGSMKSDIFRYFILYEYGGFYADIDTICFEPIDAWVNPDYRFILSPEDNSSFFEQWFLGSEKKHPILKRVLDNIKKQFKVGIDYSNPNFVHTSTGPSIFTDSVLAELKIQTKGQLRELSNQYNSMKIVMNLGVHIYDDYRYFRDGKPNGVIKHLYASQNWFNNNYDNWQIQRKHINQTSDETLNIKQRIKNELIPIKIPFKKIRIGNIGDGGYVMFDFNIRKIQKVYAYGIGNNIAFENDLARRVNTKCVIYLYDHTISNLPNLYSRNKMIVKKDKATSLSVPQHVKANADNNKDFMLLKMDIEGDEWEILQEMDESLLARFSQIIIEFHTMSSANLSVLKKLNNTFYLGHVHGNNYAGLIDGLPEVLECTYIKKKLVPLPVNIDRQKYPIPNLDYPNSKSTPDLILDYW